MTQEDKDLLLKDLCGRVPYRVKCKYDDRLIVNTLSVDFFWEKIEGWERYVNHTLKYDVENIKPYLFPLSSMTGEQQEEFDRIYADDMQVVANNLKNRLDGKPYETNLGHYRHIDWLNANHFDYRGLIPMGLSIDATGLNIY